MFLWALPVPQQPSQLPRRQGQAPAAGSKGRPCSHSPKMKVDTVLKQLTKTAPEMIPGPGPTPGASDRARSGCDRDQPGACSGAASRSRAGQQEEGQLSAWSGLQVTTF